MRTLTEITDAARRGKAVSHGELLYAVVAYDVLLSRFQVEKYPVLLAEFFKAAELDPKTYIGPANDPAEQEAREWHETFINLTVAPDTPSGREDDTV